MNPLLKSACLYAGLFTAAFLIVDCSLNAQPTIQWQNTIGGSSVDVLNSIQQTGDGGYILCGWSASSISGDKTENNQGNDDYWVVKLDPAGHHSMAE